MMRPVYPLHLPSPSSFLPFTSFLMKISRLYFTGLCSSDSETPATNNNPAAAAAAGAESSSDLPDEPCSGDVTGLDAVIGKDWPVGGQFLILFLISSAPSSPCMLSHCFNGLCGRR